MKQTTSIQCDAEQIIAHYEQKQYDQVSAKLIDRLCFFQNNSAPQLTKEIESFINNVVNLVFHVFTKEDYVISAPYRETFIRLNGIISNLATLTSHQTTDKVLKIVMPQQNNLTKLFVLYSHRNLVSIDLTILFGANPKLASLWWSNVVSYAPFCAVNAHEHKKMLSFLDCKKIENHFQIPMDRNHTIHDLGIYGTIQCVDPNKVLPIKQMINKRLEKSTARSIKHLHNNKIIVISQAFYKGHATYKSLAPLYRTLKNHYQLILAYSDLINDDSDLKDTDLFDDFIKINVPTNAISMPETDLQKLIDIKADMAFFPDASKDILNIILSNQRICPIQIAFYGHPTSTYSKYIDCFIGGGDVESDRAEQDYSEKLIKVKGLAAMPVLPEYTSKKLHKSNDQLIINCSWGNAKLHFPHLQNLKTILDRSEKEIRFNFIGLQQRNSLYWPVVKDLQKFFGSRIYYSPQVENAYYMQEMEKGDFSIDAYPYGSYNRILDALICHQPIVVLEGKQAYNRFGAALLRRMKLAELIAHTDEEFIQITLRIIHDMDYLTDLRSTIAEINLEELLVSEVEKESFKETILAINSDKTTSSF